MLTPPFERHKVVNNFSALQTTDACFSFFLLITVTQTHPAPHSCGIGFCFYDTNGPLGPFCLFSSIPMLLLAEVLTPPWECGTELARWLWWLPQRPLKLPGHQCGTASPSHLPAAQQPPTTVSEEPKGAAEPDTSVMGEIPTSRSPLMESGVDSQVHSCFTVPLHQITKCKDLTV